MLITSQATLTVLTSFTDLDESGGFDPYYLLLATNGDLYGSAYGASSGLIFELIKTQSGFSDAPVVVAEGSGSIFPELFAVDGGNLFASSYDPNNGSSGIIEFADTGTSISTTPTVLANFGSDTIVYTPAVDSAGDLFGIENSFTTIDEGRLGIFDINSSVSTLYEIEKTPNGFGQSVNLGTVDGLGGGLLVDSQGDVFISTFPALDFSSGTIYELQKTAAGYASTPTAVVAFDGIDGSFPSGVVEDTNGDLFGTTLFGGQGGKANQLSGDGTVFEIVNTATGYSSTPLDLVVFDGTTDGATPSYGVILDARGDLFGTTSNGGPNGGGTVFELVNTATGYATSPIVLAAFPTSEAGPGSPSTSLVADTLGNLFGSTGLGGSGGGGTVFELSNSGYQVSCFATGTRLVTPTGTCAIQKLRVGDLLVSARRPWPVPARWIGQRYIDCTRYPDSSKVLPIRIRAGAFGPALPVRDLWLSPDHAVFVEGVLIPVRALVNGRSIAQQSVGSVTYWHVEVDQHDVLLAEGLPVESYLDTGQRAAFIGGPMTALAPDFSSRVWEAQGCAPLRVTGQDVDAVRARLAGQHSALGQPEAA